MSFSHQTSRIYCDTEDMDGVLNVLGKRIAGAPDAEATPYYLGAHLIVNMMRNHEDLRDQSIVMRLFDNELEEHGITPTQTD